MSAGIRHGRGWSPRQGPTGRARNSMWSRSLNWHSKVGGGTLHAGSRMGQSRRGRGRTGKWRGLAWLESGNTSGREARGEGLSCSDEGCRSLGKSKLLYCESTILKFKKEIYLNSYIKFQ